MASKFLFGNEIKVNACAVCYTSILFYRARYALYLYSTGTSSDIGRVIGYAE